MKKLIIAILLSIALVACGSEESNSFDFTIDEYEARITEALKQSDMKIESKEVLEDGKIVFQITENIFIYVTVDESNKVTEVTLGAVSNTLITEKETLDFAFLLLVGTVDDSLSYADRSAIVNELELNEANLLDHLKVVNNNDIQYTFKGEKENMVLQAVPK